MINVTSLERRSKFLVKAIADKVKYDSISNPKYAYWVLYLDDNRKRPREIDTCATSYCISILEADKQKVISNSFVDKYIYHDTIQQAIRTLIKLRSNGGAWPSVVEPKILQSLENEYHGDVAIGDNFFALTALLDAGFLSEQFEYTNDIPSSLQSLEGRIKYVCQTVDWLINHRALSGDEGWYYTNTDNAEISQAVTIATSNVLIILNRIKNAIIGNSDFEKFYNKIEKVISETNEYLMVNIKTDGGIDKFISSSSLSSSLLHTCKMVDSLILSENLDYIEELEKAISFIISTCNNLDCNFKNVADDFYSERYNLVLPSKDEIVICHENYIEGLLLSTLLNILLQFNQSGSYISRIKIDVDLVTDIVNKLIIQLEYMQTRSGINNGLFKCHVVRPEGMHPVYASFEGYNAFRLYMRIQKHILSNDEKNRICEEIKKSKFTPDLPYVFISYSHKNEDAVLYDVLRLKTQFNCWIDLESIDGGRCANEDDWTEKVLPVMESPNCKGVIIYISKNALTSNGLLREAEWIQKKRIDFYTFLVDFSETISPRDMASIIYEIEDSDAQNKVRRISAFSYICQIDKDVTEFSYYHRQESFKHLSHPDFFNWIKKIRLA